MRHHSLGIVRQFSHARARNAWYLAKIAPNVLLKDAPAADGGKVRFGHLKL